jgi:hypothetical protein
MHHNAALCIFLRELGNGQWAAPIGQRFAKRLKKKQETAFENELIGCGRTWIQDRRTGNS